MKQELLGDTEDSRLTITQQRHPNKPLSVWAYANAEPRVDWFGVVARGVPTVTVGFTGVNVNEEAGDLDRYTIHVYDGTHINNLLLSRGSHHSIAKGAYVNKLSVMEEAVAHVDGHVTELIVQTGGQVILQAGSYVDRLLVKSGGYVRVHSAASVFDAVIEDGGICMLATGANCKNTTGVYGVFIDGYAQDVLQLRLCAISRQALIKIATDLTEEYKEHGMLKFGYSELSGIRDCLVLNDGSSKTGDALVLSFSAQRVSCLNQLRKSILEKYSSDLRYLELEQFGQKL